VGESYVAAFLELFSYNHEHVFPNPKSMSGCGSGECWELLGQGWAQNSFMCLLSPNFFEMKFT
jgi:hypothetical protein